MASPVCTCIHPCDLHLFWSFDLEDKAEDVGPEDVFVLIDQKFPDPANIGFTFEVVRPNGERFQSQLPFPAGEIYRYTDKHPEDVNRIIRGEKPLQVDNAYAHGVEDTRSEGQFRDFRVVCFVEPGTFLADNRFVLIVNCIVTKLPPPVTRFEAA